MSQDQTALLATIAPIFMLLLVSERRALMKTNRPSRWWIAALVSTAVILYFVTLFCLIGLDDGIDGWRGYAVLVMAVIGIGGASGPTLALLMAEGLNRHDEVTSGSDEDD
jgi:hypothetical protein